MNQLRGLSPPLSLCDAGGSWYEVAEMSTSANPRRQKNQIKEGGGRRERRGEGRSVRASKAGRRMGSTNPNLCATCGGFVRSL
jgi:hypothetical protein